MTIYIHTFPPNPVENIPFEIYADVDPAPDPTDKPNIRFYFDSAEQDPAVSVDYATAIATAARPAGGFLIGARLYHEDTITNDAGLLYVVVLSTPQGAPPPTAPATLGSTPSQAGFNGDPQTAGPPPGTGTTPTSHEAVGQWGPALDPFTGQSSTDPFTGQPDADPFTGQAIAAATDSSGVPQSVRDLIYGIYGQTPPGQGPIYAPQSVTAPTEAGMTIEDWFGNWVSEGISGIARGVGEGIISASQFMSGAAAAATYLTLTPIESVADVLRPVAAGVQVIGGAAEFVGGSVFAVVTAETGVGVAAGVAVAAHGFDQLVAGIRTLAGENAETLTYRATHDLTFALTDSEVTARATGLVVDTVSGLAGGSVAARGLGSLVAPLSSANSAATSADFVRANTLVIDVLESGPEALTATSANASRVELAAARDASRVELAVPASAIEKTSHESLVGEPSLAGSFASSDAEGIRIMGQRTVAATAEEQAKFESSVIARQEVALSRIDDRFTPPYTKETWGTPTDVVPEFGPEVTSTLHTHPVSGVAQFSVRDANAFFEGGYGQRATHSVLGYKWPSTNLVLTQEGLVPVPDVVKTTITQWEVESNAWSKFILDDF